MMNAKSSLVLRAPFALIGTVGIILLCKNIMYGRVRSPYTGNSVQNKVPNTLKNQRTVHPLQCTNIARLNYLKHMCKLRSSTIKYDKARLIEDKKNNLLYCEVSKAGCTTVKAIWIEANKRPPGSKTMNTSELEVKGQAVHNKHSMQRASLYFHKLQNWTSQFKGHIKVITVRHPYDRLVSAYYNLIYWKPGQGDGHSYVQAAYKERFQHSIHGDLTLLTFEQFLTIVTDPTVRIFNDRHWKPFTESCFVCDQEYDYILKTETLYHDMESIMKHLGHPDMKLLELRMNAIKRDSDSVNITSAMKHSRQGWSKHLPEFETLSPKTKEAITERFKNDMDLFGYDFDERTNVASCSFGEDVDARDQCC